MLVETADTSQVPITIDETSSAKGVLGAVDLRVFAVRSDLRGATRSAVHLACMAATGTLVWLTLPVWYLLVPAMFVHGITIVMMFAPMHECVHRRAFASA